MKQELGILLVSIAMGFLTAAFLDRVVGLEAGSWQHWLAFFAILILYLGVILFLEERRDQDNATGRH